MHIVNAIAYQCSVVLYFNENTFSCKKGKKDGRFFLLEDLVYFSILSVYAPVIMLPESRVIAFLLSLLIFLPKKQDNVNYPLFI